MRPSEYTSAGVLLLVAGILNVTLAVMLVMWMMLVCLGPLWLVPMLLGFVEIATGVSMLNGNKRQNGMLIAVIGMMASVLCCNPVSFVCEAVAMALMLNPRVVDWLRADDGDGATEW